MKMENQAQKKNPSKHLIISLSIIGAAVLVALIIAVVAIVGDLNNRIDGKNASELYADLESSVISESNYSYVIERKGSGMLLTSNAGVAVKADIEKVVEEVAVNGDAFYYSKTLTATQKSPNSSDEVTTTTTLKITVVDGIRYYYYGATGSAAVMLKSLATSNDFKETLTAIKSIVWDYDDLFNKSNMVENNSGHLFEMNKELALDDPALIKALKDNAEMFFTDNARSDVYPYINMSLKDFEEYDYAVTYDDSGRPVSVVYDYTMGNGNLFVGDLSVTAGFKYGNATVAVPENADDYDWATGKQ